MELAKALELTIKGGSLSSKLKLLEGCYGRSRAELELEVDAFIKQRKAGNWFVKTREEYLARFKHFGDESEEICRRLLRDKSVQVRTLAALKAERLETRVITRRDDNSGVRSKASDRSMDVLGGDDGIYAPRPEVQKAFEDWVKLGSERQNKVLQAARAETGQKEGEAMEAALTQKVSAEVEMVERLEAAGPIAGVLVANMEEVRRVEKDQKDLEKSAEGEMAAIKADLNELDRIYWENKSGLQRKEEELREKVASGGEQVRVTKKQAVEKLTELVAEAMGKGEIPLDQFGLPHSLSGPILRGQDTDIYAIHGVVVDERLFFERPARESPGAAKARIEVMRDALERIEYRSYGDTMPRIKGFKIPAETAAWLMHKLTGQDMEILFSQGYGKEEERVRKFMGLEFEL